MNTLTVLPEQQGQRLDKFLTYHNPRYSRSIWQKKIKQGEILINNKPVPPHYFLKAGDQISVISPDTLIAPPKIKITDNLIPQIIADTNNFLVLEKPAGLLTHSVNTANTDPTLVTWLRKKYPLINKVGDDPRRPGVVHRLDKEVSGLLVVAKNPEMFAHLKNQFQKHLIKKEYLALINGQLTQLAGKIDFPISRSSTHSHRMAAHPKNQAGKPALTKYEVIQKIKNFSLLKIQIITGRTHQIRVHFNALGHPIVGDHVYYSKKTKLIDLGRLFLHAHYLGFTDLTGQFVEYHSALPEKLQKFLEAILK